MPNYKFLYVEDDRIANIVGSALLVDKGYQVDVARNGQEALQMLASNSYDLIFMDIGLPDTDGYAVTEIVRTKEGPNQHKPIVALTAHEGSEYQTRAEWSGMTDFLQKPLTAEKLESVIQSHLSV